jgi:diguanylate cyclase (GGDEF)-like protein
MPARKILVIDDDPETCRLLQTYFAGKPLEFHASLSGEDGIRKAAEIQPDVILLDLIMPGIDGIEAADRLKGNPRTALTPVIFLTSCRSTDHKVKAFRAGADDFMTKPFDLEEVEARIGSQLKRRDMLLGMNSRIDHLTGNNQELEHQLTLDDKTGLCNFREFRRKLREEWMRSERYGAPLSLVMFDLDDFKKFNDTYGHQAGDIALREFATLMTGGARATDMVARYGGEEFAMILPHTDIIMATRVAERIRAAMAEFRFNPVDSPATITVSGGVAAYPTTGAVDSVDSLVEHADRALYRAKELGKNRVEAADSDSGDKIDEAHSRKYGSRTSSTLTGKRSKD